MIVGNCITSWSLNPILIVVDKCGAGRRCSIEVSNKRQGFKLLSNCLACLQSSCQCSVKDSDKGLGVFDQ